MLVIEINITEIAHSETEWVYANGNLKPVDDVGQCHPRDITNPLEFPLFNVLHDKPSSLLFPDIIPDNLTKHIQNNGIYIGHIEDRVKLLQGFVALGHLTLLGSEGRDEEPTLVIETLTHGLHAKTAIAIVDAVVDKYELNDPNSVKHFTPVKQPDNSRWRRKSRTNRVTNNSGLIGEVLSAELPDTSVSKAYGKLESLNSYRDRIG